MMQPSQVFSYSTIFPFLLPSLQLVHLRATTTIVHKKNARKSPPLWQHAIGVMDRDLLSLPFRSTVLFNKSCRTTLIIFYKGQCYFWPRLCPLFFCKISHRNVPYLSLIFGQILLTNAINFPKHSCPLFSTIFVSFLQPIYFLSLNMGQFAVPYL